VRFLVVKVKIFEVKAFPIGLMSSMDSSVGLDNLRSKVFEENSLAFLDCWVLSYLSCSVVLDCYPYSS
jgi:hypothetical protein